MLGKSKTIDDNFSLDKPSQRQHVSALSKRLHSRKSSHATDVLTASVPATLDGGTDHPRSGHRLQGVHDVLGEVAAWVHDEKQKRHARRARRKERSNGHGRNQLSEMLRSVRHGRNEGHNDIERRLSDSSDSQDSVDLDRLEDILGRSLSDLNLEKTYNRKQSARNLRRASLRRPRRYSTDADIDVEAEPPSCDAYLDNSKTLNYFNGSSSTHAESGAKPASRQDREAWLTFKYEIVRLTHTLKVKGWRQVPMEQSHEIDVERLSGALTNAVYVVAPPKDLATKATEANGDNQAVVPKKPPPWVPSQLPHSPDLVTNLATGSFSYASMAHKWSTSSIARMSCEFFDVLHGNVLAREC